MVDCSGFTSNLDCALTYSSEYHIKFTILFILLVYSAVVYYFSKNIEKEKSYVHFWLFYLSKVLSVIYIVFSPLLFMLLMPHGISLEVFITIIITFYLLFTALFIGLSIYYGTSAIWQVLGFEDWNEFKDKYKERRSKLKYG